MAMNFLELQRVLSQARLDSYKRPGKQDIESIHLYAWNTMLCESLYSPFQILEVGVRNAIHLEIGKTWGDAEWIKNQNPSLLEYEIHSITEAKISLNKRNIPIDEPELVAEMSFGFWTSLSDSRYEMLWRKIIMQVFPHMPKSMRTRTEVSKRLSAARKLRNAAFHHHSIWHWKDLASQHHDIRELIRWICPSIDELALKVDRFPRVYRLGEKECARIFGSDAEYHI